MPALEAWTSAGFNRMYVRSLRFSLGGGGGWSIPGEAHDKARKSPVGAFGVVCSGPECLSQGVAWTFMGTLCLLSYALRQDAYVYVPSMFFSPRWPTWSCSLSQSLSRSLS